MTAFILNIREYTHMRSGLEHVRAFPTACDGISNSDNLRQRLFERKPKGIKGS